jgi:hypothetical protein
LSQACHRGREVDRTIDTSDVVFHDGVARRPRQVDRRRGRTAEALADPLPRKTFVVTKRP